MPDCRLFAFTRSDDLFAGILQNRFHEAWSLRICSWHGVGNDPTYNSEGCFETFPFPARMTPDKGARVLSGERGAIRFATAASKLDALRSAWLKPSDLVRHEPEIVAGYPDRVLPLDSAAETVLKARTLTSLYNQRPRWLADAHDELDRAVAAAYGWPEDIAIDDALGRLVKLNGERTAA